MFLGPPMVKRFCFMMCLALSVSQRVWQESLWEQQGNIWFWGSNFFIWKAIKKASTRNHTGPLQNYRAQKAAFDFSYLPVSHVYQKRLGGELMLPAGPLSQKLPLTSFRGLFFHCCENNWWLALFVSNCLAFVNRLWRQKQKLEH